MADDRDNSGAHDDGLPSLEDQYELWDWARAAGVSEEELRKALRRSEQPPPVSS